METTCNTITNQENIICPPNHTLPASEDTRHLPVAKLLIQSKIQMSQGCCEFSQRRTRQLIKIKIFCNIRGSDESPFCISNAELFKRFRNDKVFTTFLRILQEIMKKLNLCLFKDRHGQRSKIWSLYFRLV